MSKIKFKESFRRKLLFSAYSMELGGIETALVSLLNNIDNNKYHVTLILEKKQGVFLENLSNNIKILEYTPSSSQNVVLRKILNLTKRFTFIVMYKNKFDFAASFATYSLPGSFIARTASKNSALWVHNDYKELYKDDVTQIRSFFEGLNYNRFKSIIFVSNQNKENFTSIFSDAKAELMVCNNLIDYKKIIQKSNEKIDFLVPGNTKVFLNIGRHEENQKKLTRIIEVAKKLKEEKYNFKILFIGNGPDTELYKKLVTGNGLEDVIIFLGIKQSPFPYFKISDAVVLSSDYEGFPVVFMEALVLNIPIITTNVSDAKKEIENKFGIVTSKDSEAIYIAMKEVIENGYEIKEKFDVKKFNKNIMDKLETIFDN